ncbi:OmpA family protein [Abyssalbus ytuae]|uniref:OmpA family protein n=1 Tax=Abyssalbus ytuae TaxID=2926907 RepID=A0A9E6ZYJ6_9FLAO|nr:OmpA family protein [Abyssalbus ytuae]UOB19336.1 OmpA family protein [Abyssalbus ytuae]
MKLLKKMQLAVLLICCGSILFAQETAYIDGTFSSEQKGDRYYDLSYYLKAKDFYIKALNKNTDNKSLHLKLARCYIGLGDIQNAKSHYTKSIDAHDATPLDFLNYAESLMTCKEYEEALKWFKVYQLNHPADIRVKNRIEGIQQREKFYRNKEMHKVNPAGFNSDKTDFPIRFYDNKIVFASNRGKPKALQLTDGRDETAFLDLYIMNEGNPVKFEPFNTSLHDGPLTFFDSGNKAVVTTSHKGWGNILKNTEKVNLKMVTYTKTANKWQYEKEFTYNNPSYSVGYPFYDKINHVLYFSSDMPGGRGGADLYTSTFENGEWSVPKNLEIVNTEGDELFPFVSKTGVLYFTSNGWQGLGGFDIYKTNLRQKEIKILNLGFPVNTETDDFALVLDESDEKGYISSNRKGGTGGDDIYLLNINYHPVEFWLSDKTTGELLEGKFTITDNITAKEPEIITEDKKVVLNAVNERAYTVKAEKEGYVSNEIVYHATNNKDTVTIPLTKDEKLATIVVNNLNGSVVYQVNEEVFRKVDPLSTSNSQPLFEINNLYFNFDSNVIESYEELQKIATLLSQFKHIKIEVITYCDEFGSFAYNDYLAEKRARKIVDYLLKKEISPNRIKVTALGKRQLFNLCKPSPCGKKEHRENRRAEFILYE